jgi:hypothetical protein
MDQSSAHAD